eukprot:6630945-Pyramimonas_sp.AAC.1
MRTSEGLCLQSARVVRMRDKDARAFGRPFRSFSSGARPAKAAKDGPRRRGCKGTLGKVAHPYYAG